MATFCCKVHLNTKLLVARHGEQCRCRLTSRQVSNKVSTEAELLTARDSSWSKWPRFQWRGPFCLYFKWALKLICNRHSRWLYIFIAWLRRSRLIRLSMTRIETNPKESFVGFQPTRKKMEPTLISFPRQTLERIFSFFLGNSKSMRVWFFKKRKKDQESDVKIIFCQISFFFSSTWSSEAPFDFETASALFGRVVRWVSNFERIRKKRLFWVTDYSAEASFYSDNPGWAIRWSGMSVKTWQPRREETKEFIRLRMSWQDCHTSVQSTRLR